jgi:hypothetical protein
MAPVWVALLAPWLLRTRRQGVDLVAVAVAVAGMVLLVLPAATAGDGDVTAPGVIFGLLGGLMFAAAMMLVSSMRDAGVRGSTFALFYCAGAVVLFTPLAVWQTAAGHYALTWADVWIVVISGLVYTALCFSLFTDGLRFVRVEHAGILGYLEPVTAPLWAFVLIGEAPAWTTYAGGALIVAAGVLVIILGKGEAESLVEPLTCARRRLPPDGRTRSGRPPPDRARIVSVATSRSASPGWPTGRSASWSRTQTCRQRCSSVCAWRSRRLRSGRSWLSPAAGVTSARPARRCGCSASASRCR